MYMHTQCIHTDTHTVFVAHGNHFQTFLFFFFLTSSTEVRNLAWDEGKHVVLFSRIFPKDFLFQAVPGPKSVYFGTETLNSFYLILSFFQIHRNFIIHNSLWQGVPRSTSFWSFINSHLPVSFHTLVYILNIFCFHRPLSYRLSVMPFFKASGFHAWRLIYTHDLSWCFFSLSSLVLLLVLRDVKK